MPFEGHARQSKFANDTNPNNVDINETLSAKEYFEYYHIGLNKRNDEVAPKIGSVRLLRLTEKQFKNIYMVTGEPDYQEKTVGS